MFARISPKCQPDCSVPPCTIFLLLHLVRKLDLLTGIILFLSSTFFRFLQLRQLLGPFFLRIPRMLVLSCSLRVGSPFGLSFELVFLMLCLPFFRFGLRLSSNAHATVPQNDGALQRNSEILDMKTLLHFTSGMFHCIFILTMPSCVPSLSGSNFFRDCFLPKISLEGVLNMQEAVWITCSRHDTLPVVADSSVHSARLHV